MRKLIASILFAACVFAQSPVFEAATIKPSKDEPGHTGWHSRTGTIQLTGHTLKSLIAVAYQVKPAQVSVGPKWMTDDRFDINAKSENAADAQQLLVMVQTLLAERFQLVFHHEERIAPAYALLLTKSGLKIKPSEDAGSSSSSSKGRMIAKGVSMAKLADNLTRQLGTTVTDLTGAPGVYDFTLEWATEGDATDLQSALFAALQTQLGLRLELRKLPTDTIVVDKAEKPSEN
jgi:uncharacterized protein (TIGR03435 family)